MQTFKQETQPIECKEQDTTVQIVFNRARNIGYEVIGEVVDGIASRENMGQLPGVTMKTLSFFDGFAQEIYQEYQENGEKLSRAIAVSTINQLTNAAFKGVTGLYSGIGMEAIDMHYSEPVTYLLIGEAHKPGDLFKVVFDIKDIWEKGGKPFVIESINELDPIKLYSDIFKGQMQKGIGAAKAGVEFVGEKTHAIFDKFKGKALIFSVDTNDKVNIKIKDANSIKRPPDDFIARLGMEISKKSTQHKDINSFLQKELPENYKKSHRPILGTQTRLAYDISLKTLDIKALDINNKEHMRVMDLSYQYLLATIGKIPGLPGGSGRSVVPLDKSKLAAKDFEYLKIIQEKAKSTYGIQGKLYKYKEEIGIGLEALSGIGVPTEIPQLFLKSNDWIFNSKFDRDFLEELWKETGANDNVESFIYKISEVLLKDGVEPQQLGLYIAHLTRAYGYDQKKKLQEVVDKREGIFTKLATEINEELQKINSFMEGLAKKDLQQEKIHQQLQALQQFQETLHHGTAFISSLANMVGDAKLAQTVSVLGHVTSQITSGIFSIAQAGNLFAAGLSPYLMIGNAIFTAIGFLKSKRQGDNSGQVIFQQFQYIAQLLKGLQEQMHGRFDRIENIMEAQFNYLVTNMFEQFAEISKDIEHIRGMNNELFRRLESNHRETIAKLNELIEKNIEASRSALKVYKGSLNILHREHFYNARHWALQQASKDSSLGNGRKTDEEAIKLLHVPENAVGYVNAFAKEIDSLFDSGIDDSIGQLINPLIFVEGASTYIGWHIKAGISDENEAEIYAAMVGHANRTKNLFTALWRSEKLIQHLVNKTKKSFEAFLSEVRNIESNYIDKKIITPFNQKLINGVSVDGKFTSYGRSRVNPNDNSHLFQFCGPGVPQSIEWNQLLTNPFKGETYFTGISNQYIENINSFTKEHKEKLREYKESRLTKLPASLGTLSKIYGVASPHHNNPAEADRQKRFPLLIEISQLDKRNLLLNYSYAQMLGVGEIRISYANARVIPLNGIIETRYPDTTFVYKQFCSAYFVEKLIDRSLVDFQSTYQADHQLFFDFIPNGDERKARLISQQIKDTGALIIPAVPLAHHSAEREGNSRELLDEKTLNDNFKWLAPLIVEKEMFHSLQIRNILQTELETESDLKIALRKFTLNALQLNSVIYLGNNGLYQKNILLFVHLFDFTLEGFKNILQSHDDPTKFIDAQATLFKQALEQIEILVLQHTKVESKLAGYFPPLDFILGQLQGIQASLEADALIETEIKKASVGGNDKTSQLDIKKLEDKIDRLENLIMQLFNEKNKKNDDQENSCQTYANGPMIAGAIGDLNPCEIIYGKNKGMSAARESLSYQFFVLTVALVRIARQNVYAFTEKLYNPHQNVDTKTHEKLIKQNTGFSHEQNQPMQEIQTLPLGNQFTQTLIGQQPVYGENYEDAEMPFAYGSWAQTFQQHPYTGEPMFTYEVFLDNEKIGSAVFYKHPLLCRSENGQRHNLLSLTGALSDYDVYEQLDTVEDICESLPPTRGEMLQITANHSIAHGAIRGAATTLSYALNLRNASQGTVYYASNGLYYISLFALNLNQHYANLAAVDIPEFEKFTTAAYQATYQTGSLMLIQQVLNQTCILANWMGQKAKTYGWENTGKFICGLGQGCGYGVYAYTQGVMHLATSVYTGIVAEKSVEIIGKAGIIALTSFAGFFGIKTSLEQEEPNEIKHTKNKITL